MKAEDIARGAQWWTVEGEGVADAICSALKAVEKDPEESSRLNDYDRYRSRYDAQLVLPGQVLGRAREINFNICQVVVDTAVSQLCSSRTAIMALTKQGDHAMQRRGKMLNFFLDGQFEASGQYELAPQIVADAACVGTGIVKICESLSAPVGTIQSRLVDACDLVVPVLEGRTANPTFMFEIERVPEDVLLARFPDAEKAICYAGHLRDYDKQADLQHEGGPETMRWVVHAYKLPIGERAGRYVIATTAGVLYDEDREDAHFPYAVMRWKPRKKCFWGIPMLQDIDSVQEELDHLCWKIQDHMSRASTQIWHRKGSTVAPEKSRTNLAFTHHEFMNEPPIAINIPPIHDSYFRERQELFDKAFQMTGVTPLAASGMKPAGLNAGKALRLYKDIANNRLKMQQDSIERVQVESGKRMIALAKEIDARGDGDYRIMAKSKKGLLFIRWNDVAMDKEQFQLQIFPVGYLSQTPAGKAEDLNDLLQLMPQIQPFIPKALDYPDLEAIMSLATAASDEALTCLESIEDGVYMAPDPQTDPLVALPLALAYYRKLRANEGDPETMQMMRDYISQLNQLLSDAKAQQAEQPVGASMNPLPPPPPPGMAPPMPGM